MAVKKPEDELFHHSFDGIQEYDNDLPGWWKWLFYLCIAFAVGYLLHYHVLATGDLQKTEYKKEYDSDYESGPDETGGRVFAAYKSPWLSSVRQITPRMREEQRQADYAVFEENILLAMKKADAEQLGKLQAAFPEIAKRFEAEGGRLSGGAGPEPEPALAEPLKDAAALADGKAIFESQCMTCHGMKGEGGIGPNMTDEYWIHGGAIADIIHIVRKGVPEKGMISWEKTLTPDQINNVSSFILVKLQGTNPPNAKPPQGDKAGT